MITVHKESAYTSKTETVISTENSKTGQFRITNS